MNEKYLAYKLYQYNGLIDEVVSRAVDNETGEIVSEQAELELKNLILEKQITAIDLANVVKNHRATIEMMKRAEDEIKDRRKKLESRNENYIRVLESVIGEKEKLDNGETSIAWRKNQGSVVVGCPVDVLPKDCIRVIPEQHEPDKKAIAAKLKAGQEIPLCFIRESSRLEIK